MNPEDIHAFAKKEIRSSLVRRYKNHEFSRDLWKKMADKGLFRFLVPSKFGGSGHGPGELVKAIQAFMTGGHDLGLCLSWLDHLLIHTHVIARFGTPRQKEKYLPGLVSGERIGALAASEPGTGANPVKMSSHAERQNGTYRILGEKIFITNGPIADFVIVLARTGPLPGKEGISAFLMDTSTQGFRVKKRMDFGFLNTSPHGELAFDGCLLPEENLLGKLGDGHVRISRAVFAWERFLLLVALSAHFGALFHHLIREMPIGSDSRSDELGRTIASAHVTLEGLGELAGQLACEVLGRNDLDRRLTERLLYLGQGFHQWRNLLEQILRHAPSPLSPTLSILLKDAKLMDINQQLIKLQLDRVSREVIQRARQERN